MDKTGQNIKFPIKGKLCSVEEISELAVKIRAVPEDEYYKFNFPYVTKRILSTEFLSVFVDLYSTNEDIQFRRDATLLLKGISKYGDPSKEGSFKELVDRGITKLILSECEDSDDADLMTNIVTVLRHVSSAQNFALLPCLASDGLYGKLFDLLTTWKTNDDIVAILLAAFIQICFLEMEPSKDNDLQDSCNGLLGEVKRNYQLFEGLLGLENSCKVIVRASLILNKCLGIMGDTEMQERLIPPPDKIFTEDGISKLVGSLDQLTEFLSVEVVGQMIDKRLTSDFVDKFVETYDSHSDLKFRKNMIHVAERLAHLEDKDITCSLIESGVVEYLIKVCEDCTDSGITSNIFDVLKNIAANKEDSPTQLVEMGMFSKIVLLLRKWRKDESVMTSLLRALFWLTFRDVKDIEESLTNTSEHGDIPNILQEIIETSTSDSVINETFGVIKNLSDTELLHQKFINPQFFSNAFSQLKSGNLENGTKIELLNGAILALAHKNPNTTNDMLSPHIESLKELAKADDGEISINVAAVILLNKHLGCNVVTENIQYLVPELDKMFTDEGISRLASCIKAIPYTEEEFEKEVVSKIVSTGFISKIIESYDNHSEKDYRRNLFCVTEKVAYCGDEEAKCSLVETGVVKHFIKACENCTDSEIICYIIDIIKSIAMNSKISQEKLVKIGCFSDICSLFKKWCNDESVITILLNAVYFMTTGREDIEDSLENIPNILQEIVETNTSDRVIDDAFDLIKIIVRDTNALQAEFLNPAFFNSIFNRLKSNTITSSSITEVLLGLETKNARKTNDLLSPHIQLLKELSESDDSNVGAVLLLHKCLDGIGDTEAFKLLVPDLDVIYTKDGVSRLAATIGAIPYTELDFEKQFLVHLVSTGSSEKFIHAYETQSEVEYCRNLTYVLKEIVMYAGDDAASSVVKSGISEHLINSCENCSDGEVMDNISTTLQFLTYDDANIIQLGEQGVLKCVPTLLKRWIGNERGESIADSLIIMLTKMSVSVVVKERIVSLVNVGVNIPEVLVDIFETSSDLDVLKGTIDCIKNMLTDSMMLHEHFSNQKFIDTCISRTKGDDLDTEYKVKILWSIVTRLSYNNPSKFAELLSPHTHL